MRWQLQPDVDRIGTDVTHSRIHRVTHSRIHRAATGAKFRPVAAVRQRIRDEVMLLTGLWP